MGCQNVLILSKVGRDRLGSYVELDNDSTMMMLEGSHRPSCEQVNMRRWDQMRKEGELVRNEQAAWQENKNKDAKQSKTKQIEGKSALTVTPVSLTQPLMTGS